ncbi:MAG: HD domain-containing phosphohydrolase [Gemmatimonadales bacterium]
MKYLLLHSASWTPRGVSDALADAHVEARPLGTEHDLTVDERPTVFLLDAATRGRFPLEVLRAFVDGGGAIVALGQAGETEVPDALPVELLAAFLPLTTPRQLLLALRAGFREAAGRRETANARAEAAARSRETHELARIGAALGTERDLKTLLDLILTQARQITESDAGSLYLLVTPEAGTPRLRFRLAQNHSKPDVPFVEFTVPVDRTSLAGYTAVTAEPLNIPDAYFLPPDAEYSINKSFDQRVGYRTKSVLVVPMKDHKDQLIGVLQLINRKRRFDSVLASPEDVDREVVPYSKRTEDLATSLATQAAVAIENSQLYENIEKLFEGFVQAAVTAIEQRDPTTEGHSKRVASYTVELAEVVDRSPDGPYRAVRFTREQLREIRYAGLLHDFGKVGVREQVLVKAKKLYPTDLALIRQRYGFVRRTAERDYWRRRAEFLQHGGDGYEGFVAQLDEAHQRELEQLNAFLALVLRANEPSVVPQGQFDELVALAGRTYEDVEGTTQPFLTGDEVRYLTIRKGSLDEQERAEIESHVNHTYDFLKQIPWTRELKDVPLIAYGHHEKLDGRGYPRRVSGDDIPVQTRMMTIADIYDALTAQDRPYKPAVRPERALDIMSEEVGSGQLDRDLFNLFIEAKVFEKKVE